MKLATLKDGSRDGQLAVVSRDLAQAHFATGIATRLAQVLDDWNFLAPQLEDLYATLNGGKARHAFAFDPRLCMAPLPRPPQRAEAQAYGHHRQRLLALAGETAASTPDSAAPWLQAAGAEPLLGATDTAFFFDAAQDIDFGAGLAVITGDLPLGATPEQALDSVRLLLLHNAFSLRRWQVRGGGGGLHARPLSACSPLAVTPDELGEAWQGGRVLLPLQSSLNGRRLGLPDAGEGMDHAFGALLAELARTRPVGAGCLFAAGTVANADPARGCGSLADKRALEAADGGEVRTAWLAFGDRLRIEMKGRDGQSIFGAIEQPVVGPGSGLEAAETAEGAEAPEPAADAEAAADADATGDPEAA